MKTSELFSEVKFKDVFNILYKQYYKSRKLPYDKMMEISMSYQKLFEKCQFDGTEIQDIINEEELAAHILYYLHK